MQMDIIHSPLDMFHMFQNHCIDHPHNKVLPNYMYNRLNTNQYNMLGELQNLAPHNNMKRHIAQPMFPNFHMKHHIQPMLHVDIQLLSNSHMYMFLDSLVGMYYNPLQNYRFHHHTPLLLSELVEAVDMIHNLLDKTNMILHYYKTHPHSNTTVLVVNMTHNPLDKMNNPRQNHMFHLHNMHSQSIIVCKCLVFQMFLPTDDSLPHTIVGHSHVSRLFEVTDDMFHHYNVMK